MPAKLSNLPAPNAHDDDDTRAQALRAIASKPLEFRPDFPQVARRHEAWWAHDCLDRPLFLAQTNLNPIRPITKRLELLDRPDTWLAEKLRDMRQWHRVGDTLPNVRVDFGPVLLGGLLGGRVEFCSNTTWTHSFIDDEWSKAPDGTIDESRPLWRWLVALAETVARDCHGRYIMCTPDFGGGGDVLMNLRSPDALCLDLFEQPDRIVATLDNVTRAWRHAFDTLYRIAISTNAPIFHWLGVWSDQPYCIPACDFSALIGPREFERSFLPDIARQASSVGRAVFHLDGPDAARHVKALLSVPAIDAIQFTPGAANPSAIPWIDMFRTIQSAGRSVLVVAPAAEVDRICDSLRPEGLCIMLGDAPRPADLDDLFSRFRRRFGASD